MLAFLQDELEVVRRQLPCPDMIVDAGHEVLLRGKPAVSQHLAELDGVRHAGRYHCAHQFVFGALTGLLKQVYISTGIL